MLSTHANHRRGHRVRELVCAYRPLSDNDGRVLDIASHLSAHRAHIASLHNQTAAIAGRRERDSSMTTYSGFRDQTGHAHVAVEHGGELRPLPHLVRHSPTGMEWGCAGSGPADLARSILGHFLAGCVAPHPRIYQRFKFLVVASLPRNQNWTLTSEEVQAVLNDVLDHEGVTCALCADQGQIWPDQRLTRAAPPTFCACVHGRSLAAAFRKPYRQ